MLGSLLIVASFFAFAIMSAVGFANFANQTIDLTEVAPGEPVQMELEAKNYLLYSERYDLPAITITGDTGELRLNLSDVWDENSKGSTNYSSFYYFIVPTPGTYVISNAGPDMVAVGSQDFGILKRGVGLGFLVGTMLGVSGLIMIGVTRARRRNARKQLGLPAGT